MTAVARPVTDEQREAARRFADERVDQIRHAWGFITVKRYDHPQPQFGIHEVTGLQVRRQIGARLTGTTIGLYTGLIADELLARYRFENPMVSTLTWRHMAPDMKALIVEGSFLPVEWKSAEVTSGHFLDSRVRFTAVTPVLRFLAGAPA